MNNVISDIREMRSFLILWITQAASSLGSSMTSYALIIWTYADRGSALVTAMLMVSSYAPYVLCSVFAGAIIDRLNKKRIILVCDSAAAVLTLFVLLLLKTDSLVIWHLYIINALAGLMNTLQQPASEVVTTVLLPIKHYQRVGGLKYFSNSLNSILTPVIATAVLAIGGIETVIAIDLWSFLIAFATLLLFIKVPEPDKSNNDSENLTDSVKIGLNFLRREPGIFHLMLFLAGINLVASMFNTALPAMMLSKPYAGEYALGIVNTVSGITMLLGSVAASLLKAPKSRVRVIWWCLALSMSTENFFLAFSDSLPLWCFGAFLGWIAIPLMSTNLDAIYRLNIPGELQGRVFAVRNAFQFFTIPVGYFLGGFLVDLVFEPFMAMQNANSVLVRTFGEGKGSGAAFFFAVIGLLGVIVCICFKYDKYIINLEKES